VTTVHAPNEHFTGRVAGVVFDGGVAEIDELTPGQRAYFRQAGYGIGHPAARPVEVPVDHPLKVHVGTGLRDAAQGQTRRLSVLLDGVVVYEGAHPADVVGDAVRAMAHIVAPYPAYEPPVGPGPEDSSTGAGDDDGERGTSPSEPAPMERPKVRDGINVWREYRLRQGHDPDLVAEATKDQLQAMADQPGQAPAHDEED
jgi:hypothetical protein